MSIQIIATPETCAHIILSCKGVIRSAEAEHNAARAELLASAWDREPLAVSGLGTVSYVSAKCGSTSVDKPALDTEVQRAAAKVASAQGRIRRLLVQCADPDLAKALGAIARDLDSALVETPTKTSSGAKETIAARLA